MKLKFTDDSRALVFYLLGFFMLIMNIATEILKIAEKNKSRTIIIDAATERKYTYKDLINEVESYSRGLIKQGIKKGDRVALVCFL